MDISNIKIICEKISLGEIDSWISEPIDSHSRYLIHEQIELVPELELTTKSIIIEGIKDKKKIMIFTPFEI